MTDRPLILTAPEVRAVLDGRKTQVRVPVRPQPEHQIVHGMALNRSAEGDPVEKWMRSWGHQYNPDNDWFEPFAPCPLGRPGDRLWARESFIYATDPFAVTVGIRYRADGAQKWFGSQEGLIPDGRTVWNSCGAKYPHEVKWRPSVHMPKWAARIWLEVLDVRAERLQEIRYKDVFAEGFKGNIERMLLAEEAKVPFHWFIDAWDARYAKKGLGWEVNPTVFVGSFKRTEGP